MRNRFFLLILSLVITGAVVQSARAQNGTDLVIDDFTEGAYKVELATGSKIDYKTGSSNSIVGGVRQTYFSVSQPTTGGFNRSSILDIPRGGPMIIESGLKSYFGIYLSYGYDIQGNANPLNLKLKQRGFDRFRINLDSSDLEMGYAVQVWDGNGNRATYFGQNTMKDRYSPSSVDLPFADFEPGYPNAMDWDDIDFIIVLFQSGSAIGANDFAVTSIVATTPAP
jgi:hypothetical protein